jgi:hypothetical protein
MEAGRSDEDGGGQRQHPWNRRPASTLAALATALLLAGCVAPTGDNAADAGIVAEDEIQPPADIYRSESDPDAPGMASLPPIDDDPNQLIGLDRAALGEKLGEPALVRRDGDAEVWQYRAENCVLDLFLYGEEKEGKKVEHVDLRDRGEGDDSSVRECFVGMLRAAMPAS